MVVQGETSFHSVDNIGLRDFVQLMVQMGSKYGNIDVVDLLYSRSTIEKMNECQDKIDKKLLSMSSKVCLF